MRLRDGVEYICEKGHRFGSKTQIIVEEGLQFVEALPYSGDYCTVCYMAFVASNISRVKEIPPGAESEP